MSNTSKSRTSIVDSVFSEFVAKKLDSEKLKDSDKEGKKHKSKSHKEKHKKHKDREKSKSKDDSNEVISRDRDERNSRHESANEVRTISLNMGNQNLEQNQNPDESDSDDVTTSNDTGFFAKEGFLEPKNKSHKKHKKHKKHKHKKDKKKSKSKDKSKRDQSSDSSGSDSEAPLRTPLSPKNERALQYEKDLRQRLISLKDNLNKRHKALEDIAKATENPSKKIKLSAGATVTDKSGDKQNKTETKGTSSHAVDNSKPLVSPRQSETTVDKDRGNESGDVNGDGESRNVRKSSDGSISIQLSTIALPPGEPKSNTNSVTRGREDNDSKSGTESETTDAKSHVDEDGFKKMIPRSVKLAATDAKDSDMDEAPKAVAPPVGLAQGKKTLNLKISSSSASLISSGVILDNPDPKKKPMEDGELTASEKSSSDSDVSRSPRSSSDRDRADDSSDGEITDSRKKKSKSNKKDKKRKDSSERKSSKREKERSRERGRRDRSRTPKKSRRRSRSRSRSKSFDKERGVWKGDEKNPWKRRRSRSSSRDRRRNRSRDRDRRRSRSPSHRDRGYYDRERSRPFYARGRRDRSRSRSRERSRRRSPSDLRLKIDRVKLREIAMKNMYAAVHSGRSIQDLASDQIAALKAGGKSLDELTDFCKKITEKEALKAAGEMSDSDHGAYSDHEGDQPFINHPFSVREPTNMEITMRIRNAKQLPVSSFAERQEKAAELRLQFPVSSGTVHKGKEDEWTPVQPDTTPAPAPAPVQNKPKPKPPTPKEKEPAQNNAQEFKDAMLMPPPPPPGKPEVAESSPAPVPNAADKIITLEEPVKPEDKVFPDRPPDLSGPLNIGAIVSERLSAMRKLQDNPHDVEAMGKAYKAQKAMDTWALSKQQPGQWMGGTGIKKTETDLHKSGFQAWAKKDQFSVLTPISGGIGMALLQKMGWKQGEGLGKESHGEVEPIKLDFKADRRGLVSEGEAMPGTKKAKGNNPPIRDLSGKHPVSAVMELAKKRRWDPPVFELAFESGPPHKKNFLFKVKVGDTWYQPTIASNNKKHGKAQAAAVCLQSFGLLPKDGPI